mmetsp:Transcript_49597/g.130869  ORF Transcript_49597/g.130869 Transcript_49597/m.130869 type:complete len:171 (+) Transcript_49597:84-596(+)
MAVMDPVPEARPAEAEQRDEVEVLDSEEAKRRHEQSLRYRQKFREALHLRQVRLYERAWEECLRRELSLARRSVRFSVKYNTCFGQELCLIGSCPEIGAWHLDRSMPMCWTEGNIWVVKVDFPSAVSRIEYKYIVKEGADKAHWEDGNNHTLDLLNTSGVVQQCDSWGCG